MSFLTSDEIYSIADKAESVTRQSSSRDAHQKAIENAIREALLLQMSRLVTLEPSVVRPQIDLSKM